MSSADFEIEIADGSTAEYLANFSTGELRVGVTRNGELSDAVYRVVTPGTNEEVARGRTYTGANSNPASMTITSGTYEVFVGSVEISGRPSADLGRVTIEPGGTVEVDHDFISGTLAVGAERNGQLIDATLSIVNTETRESVGRGRTYTSANSNPKTFLLPVGEYRVTVSEIGGGRREITVSVAGGEVVERMVDPGDSR